MFNDDLPDEHFSGLTLDLNTFSGQLIQLFTLMFDCRVHGRNLKDLTCKGADHLPERIPVGNGVILFQDFSCHILCIRNNTQPQDRPVLFIRLQKQVAQPCRTSHTDRKNPPSLRVEGSHMSDLFLSGHPAQLIDHIVAGHAAVLIDYNNPVIHSLFTQLQGNQFRQIVDHIVGIPVHGTPGCPHMTASVEMGGNRCHIDFFA